MATFSSPPPSVTVPVLPSLVLQGRQFNYANIDDLLNILRQNKSVTEIDLSNNKLGNRSIALLTEELKDYNTLTGLVLDGNCIGEKGAVKILELFVRHRNLRTLSLDNQNRPLQGPISAGTALQIKWHLRYNRSLQQQEPSHSLEDSELLGSAAIIKHETFDHQNTALCAAYELLEAIPELFRRHIQGDLSLTCHKPITIFQHIADVLQQPFPLEPHIRLLYLKVALQYLYLGITKLQDEKEETVFYNNAISDLQLKFSQLHKIVPEDFRFLFLINSITSLLNLPQTDRNLWSQFLLAIPAAISLEGGSILNSVTVLYRQISNRATISVLYMNQLCYLAMAGYKDALKFMGECYLQERKSFVTLSYIEAIGEILKRSTNPKLQQEAWNLLEAFITDHIKEDPKSEICIKIAEVLVELPFIHNETLARDISNYISSLKEPASQTSMLLLQPLSNFQKEGWDKYWRYYRDHFPVRAENATATREPLPIIFPATSSASSNELVWGEPPFDTTLYVNRSQVETEVLSAGAHSSETESSLVSASIQGLPGFGKSTLARYLFEKGIGKYPIRLWFCASSKETLENSCRQLWKYLTRQDVDMSSSDALTYVKDWIESQSKYLVVYDDASSEIIPYLPKSGNERVVVTTTRETSGFPGKKITIEDLSEDEATELVHKILPHEKSTTIIHIFVDRIGKMPLWLNCIASYILNQPSMTITAFLSKSNFSNGVPDPLGKIFTNIVDQLRDKDSLGLPLLFYCSYLFSENIPLSFLRACLEQVTEDLVPDTCFETALNDVLKYSLFRINRSTGTVNIHKLVQQTVCRVDNRMKEIRLTSLLQIYRKLVDDERQKENIFLGPLFLPHLRAIQLFIDENWIRNNTELHAWLESQIQRLQELSKKPLIDPLIMAARANDTAGVNHLLQQTCNVQVTDARGYSALHLAAKHGNIEVIEKLLQSSAEANSRSITGKTPLMLAIKWGRLQAIQLLIENGAAVNVLSSESILGDVRTPLMRPTGKRWTPLMFAARNGNETVIRLLIKQGAQIRDRNIDSRTAFLIAVRYGQRAAVEALLELGANIDDVEYDGTDALLTALFYHHSEMAKLLLERGISVTKKYPQKNAPLILAAYSGDTEIVRKLFDGLATTNIKIEYQSAFLVAVQRGYLEIAKMLYDRGVDINFAFNKDWTPLMHASHANHSATVEWLICSGANLDKRDRNGRTALFIAASREYPAIVELLCQRAANIHQPDVHDWTPLMAAAYNGNRESVRILLEFCAKIGARDHEHKIALMYAAQMGHTEVVRLLIMKITNLTLQFKRKGGALLIAAQNNHHITTMYLLDAGAAIDEHDDQGRTALMFASQNGNEETVTQLLERGADFRKIDKEGRGVLVYAAKSSNPAVIEKLRVFKADFEGNPKDGTTAFMIAIELGNALSVRLLYNPKQINSKNGEGWTPMLFAAKHGDMTIIRFLKDSGEATNVASCNKVTPIMVAAQYGNVDAALFFIAEGLQVTARDQDGCTPLMYAVSGGHDGIVTILMEHGAEIESQTEKGHTPLMIAALHGRYSTFKFLKDRHAKTDIKDHDHWTLLMCAAEGGSVEILQMVLEWQGNIDAQNINGWTALMIAARHGHVRAVKFLLEKKAKIEVVDLSGNTALFHAAEKDRNEVIPILVQNGARADIKNGASYKVLMQAAADGHKKAVETLIQLHIDVESCNEKKETALMHAAYAGDLRIVKILRIANAQLNCSDIQGNTPLMWAARGGNVPVIQYLLAQGALIEQTNNRSMTALFFAVQNARIDAIKILLLNKARIDIRDTQQQTVLMSACSNGNMDAINALLKAPLLRITDVLQTRDIFGNTPLIFAAKKGHVAVIRFLLSQNILIDTTNKEGKTALFIAVEYNQIDAVKKLLQSQAQINIQNGNGMTPLMCACHLGYFDIVSVLLENVNIDLEVADHFGKTALYHASEQGYSAIVNKLLSVSRPASQFKLWKNPQEPIPLQSLQRKPVPIQSVRIVDINKVTTSRYSPLHIAAEMGHYDVVAALLSGGAKVDLESSSGKTALDIARPNVEDLLKLHGAVKAKTSCTLL